MVYHHDQDETGAEQEGAKTDDADCEHSTETRDHGLDAGEGHRHDILEVGRPMKRATAMATKLRKLRRTEKVPCETPSGIGREGSGVTLAREIHPPRG